MTKNKPPPPALSSKLAALTKAKLIAKFASLPCAQSYGFEACPAQRLELELGMHQAELEAQNHELRESQTQIEEARDRYSDLYDFAPVGYVSLDRLGCVQEINLTGAAMLGGERKNMLGKPLVLWLQADAHATFYQHLKRTCESSERVVDEMTLRGDSGPARQISMVSVAISHGPQAWHVCRTALVDITPLKEKEAELTLSRRQLQDLSAHLDRVREDERRHLAREIHDELGQKLTSLRFEVALVGERMNSPQADWSHTAKVLLKQIDDTIESVRAIATDLRPAVLDLGLTAAIEWQVQEFSRRSGIACDLKISDEEIPLENARATAVFRIVQESLTNILRHASADKIQLNLDKRADRLHIRIADNGVGMPADAMKKSRSFGIAGIRERLRLLDGTLEISSRPGQGTQLIISIPVNERREQASNRDDGSRQR